MAVKGACSCSPVREGRRARGPAAPPFRALSQARRSRSTAAAGTSAPAAITVATRNASW